jgi:hypothetical protein
MSGFIKPTDLKEISSEAEAAEMNKEAKFKKQQEKAKKELHEAFLARDVHPDVVERVNNAVRIAAQQGLQKIEVITFPCSYCNDRGRRINNLESDWPSSLEGFAKKAYDFYDKELKQLGFKVSAEVISFEDGMPGTIAMYLKW